MPFNRLHLEGVLAGTAERWSTSFAFRTAGGSADVDAASLGAWCDDVLGLFVPGTGWPGTMKSMLGTGSSIDRVSAYYYPTTAGDATAAGESGVAAVAGSGSITVPLQSALVYTLQTGIPGRSYRGRSYWPFLSATFSAGKILTSSVTLVARATAFAEMLDAIGDANGLFPGLRPAVVSKAQDAVTLVTSVRVGDVMDTQRRRRDDLPELFGTAVIP